MIDLKINNAGDIVSEDKAPMAKIALTWKIEETPTIRLRFKTGINSKEFAPASDALNEEPIHFIIDTKHSDKEHSVASCTDEEELRQRVLLLTRSIPRVVRQKHKDATDPMVQEEVRAAVLSRVKDVLDDPSVIVRKEEYAGVFSWQNLSVYIYDGKKEIYNFELEG